jgi:hypothetical protein
LDVEGNSSVSGVHKKKIIKIETRSQSFRDRSLNSTIGLPSYKVSSKQSKVHSFSPRKAYGGKKITEPQYIEEKLNNNQNHIINEQKN